MINRWLFSTNHKDVGTLYLLFARFSGSQKLRTRFAGVLCTVFAILFVSVVTWFLRDIFCLQTVALCVGGDPAQTPPASMISDNTLAAGTIAGILVTVAAVAGKMGSNPAKLAALTGTVIEVVAVANGASGSGSLSVAKIEATGQGFKVDTEFSKTGNPEQYDAANSVLEPLYHIGQPPETPTDAIVSVLNNSIVLLTIVGVFLVLIVGNTLFHQFFNTIYIGLLENKTSKFFIYLKKALTFSATFNKYYIMFLFISSMLYIIVVISWLTTLKNIFC